MVFLLARSLDDPAPVGFLADICKTASNVRFSGTKRTVLELRGISANDPERTLRRFGTFQCRGLSGYAALVLNLEGHDEAARVHHAHRWRRGRFVMRCASTTACEAGY